MRATATIHNQTEITKILQHLAKIGRAPPAWIMFRSTDNHYTRPRRSARTKADRIELLIELFTFVDHPAPQNRVFLCRFALDGTDKTSCDSEPLNSDKLP